MTNSNNKGQQEGELVWGHSANMKELQNIITYIAKSDFPVLIEGETGTGKELIAQAIQQQSNRSRNPFIRINCATIPETLIESTLFGHEKGAFTGAYTKKPGLFTIANGGTIFLDEIGDANIPFLSKLLRVMQEQSYYCLGGLTDMVANVRIIAATSKNVKLEIEKGSFNKALYERFTYSLLIPPLRDRKEDILTLLEYFVKKYNYIKSGLYMGNLLSDWTKEIMAFDWPGNVRQLEQFVKNALTLGESYAVKKFIGEKNSGMNLLNHETDITAQFYDTLDTYEGLSRKDTAYVLLINYALKIYNNNVAIAAKKLGIAERTLYRWIDKIK